MSYTNFIVTVVSTGSGNKYFIDGVQQATVALAKGATYRFDQSDSSNGTGGTHPLRFSSDSGNSNPYTTGVTAVGTPGQAGAYTQIAVDNSAPSTLYYYCTNHGAMGGAANVTATSWGALSWNLGAWGNQADIDVTATGIAATSNIGTTEAFPGEGWGARTWGFGNWGEIPNSDVILSGISATSSTGSVSLEILQEFEVTGIAAQISIGNSDPEVLNNGWGIKAWGFGAWGLSGEVLATGQQLTTTIASPVISIDVNIEASGIALTSAIGSSSSRIDADASITGMSLQTNIGNSDQAGNVIVIPSTQVATGAVGQSTIDPAFLIGEGWGRETWGNLAWGVNYSVIGGGVNGIALTSTIGNEDAFSDFTAEVSGSSMSTAIAQVGTIANSDQEVAASLLATMSVGDAVVVGIAEVDATGIAATVTVDQVEGGTKQEVDVTGVSIQTSIGNEDTFAGSIVEVSGIAATSVVGANFVTVSTYVPGSASATASAGQVQEITGNSLIIPTGIGLTATTGSPNIIAWAEVDVGTPVVWTEVDLAA